MKKIIFLLFFFPSLIHFCLGQADQSSFGFIVSPTLGWMNNNDNLINSNGVRLGMKLGGIGEYYASDWLIIYGGATFSLSQGGTLLHKFGGDLLPDSKLSDPQINSGQKPLPDDVEIKYSLQLFEVPVGLRYEIGLINQPFDLYFIFPEFNLGIISKSIGAIQATGISLEKQDIGKDVKAFNFAWGIGAGLKLPMQNQHYSTFGIHLQKGLSDVTANNGYRINANGNRETEDSKASLNSLIFKFAYFF